MPGAAPQPDTLDAALGLEIAAVAANSARGRFTADERVRGAGGAVHGGAYAALAESLCVLATEHDEAETGARVSVASASTSVLRDVTDGAVDAHARRRHRGRRSRVWEVAFADAEGRACALARVTVAVAEGATR